MIWRLPLSVLPSEAVVRGVCVRGWGNEGVSHLRKRAGSLSSVGGGDPTMFGGEKKREDSQL